SRSRLGANEPSGLSGLRDLQRHPIGALEARIVEKVVAFLLRRRKHTVRILKIGVQSLRLLVRANNRQAQAGKEAALGERIIEWTILGEAANGMRREHQPGAVFFSKHQVRLSKLHARIFHQRLEIAWNRRGLAAGRQADLAEDGGPTNPETEG